MGKRLVLGCALSYNISQINRFVTSVNKVRSENDDFAFLVSHDTKKEVITYLQENNIQYYKVQTYLNYIPKSLSKYRFSRKFSFITRRANSFFELFPKHIQNALTINATKFFHHIALSRYAYYYDIIKANEQYDKVFLTDVRDVVFQDNPFNFNWDSDLFFFLEDDSYDILHQPLNNYWIKTSFSEEALNKIGHNRVSCSGTTMGNRDAILKYCLLMSEEHVKQIYKLAGANGHDQGVHNYLIYNNSFDNYTVKFFNNNQGPVLTMYGMKLADIRIKGATIVDDTDKVIPVLHQFDRYGSIEQML